MSIATDEPTAHQRINTREITVWDPLVRVGHWLLVVLFFVAYITEDDLLTVHSWAGYGVGIYVIVRVIWGFVGPKHARFNDFAYGPARAARYVKDLVLFKAKRYVGHSPAGGVMVFAFLVCLALTVVSGVALLAVEENAGPLAPWLGRGVVAGETMPAPAHFIATAKASGDERDHDDEHDDRDRGENAEALEEFHEFMSNLTLLLVIMHIAGVVLASVVHRENLVYAMITGRKRS